MFFLSPRSRLVETRLCLASPRIYPAPPNVVHRLRYTHVSIQREITMVLNIPLTSVPAGSGLGCLSFICGGGVVSPSLSLSQDPDAGSVAFDED